MKRLVTMLVAVVCVLATMAPARAANVNVALKVSIGNGSAGGVTKSQCSLAVPAGSNGIQVLDAAVTAGCISNFKTTNTAQGRFLECIDHICGAIATYWAMRENGTYTNYGIEGFSAAPGDQLWFAYEEWVTCYPISLVC